MGGPENVTLHPFQRVSFFKRTLLSYYNAIKHNFYEYCGILHMLKTPIVYYKCAAQNNESAATGLALIILYFRHFHNHFKTHSCVTKWV